MTPVVLLAASLLPQGPSVLPHSSPVREAAQECRLDLEDSFAGERGRHDPQAYTLDVALEPSTYRGPSAAASDYALRQDMEGFRPGSGIYIELDVGYSVISGHTANDFGFGQEYDLKVGESVFFGGALGYRFENAWRMELNYNTRNADVDTVDGLPSDGDIDLASVLFNVYYDFRVDYALQPYIGFGLGSGSYDVDTPVVSESESSAFAYSFMFGVSYRFHRAMELNVGYRYLGMSGIFGGELDVNELVVGVRYSF